MWVSKKSVCIVKMNLCAVGFVLLSVLANAAEIDMSVFNGYNAAFVTQNINTGEVINLDPVLSAQRRAPCSTFKIYNTLIGLELGLLKGADDPWYKWDGVKRFIDSWNQDLTLRQAFRVSAVPAYQQLAREIGMARMKPYIEALKYGSEDMSAGIDRFWLPSPDYTALEISADEQVALMKDLFEGKLPFTATNIAVLKEIMKGTETAMGTLYGKTGSGTNANGDWNLGWYVGFWENDGNITVFACNITGGDTPSGLVARKLVEKALGAHI